MQGSDTMLVLAAHWAEAYMKLQPNISIYFEGGGTAQGVDALVAGKIDICTASRTLQPDEVQLLAKKYGKIGLRFLVAKDALSVYVHPQNPVKNLTLSQLKQIFTGQVSNWQEIGGKDTPIDVFIRPPNSGTYLYFKNHVLEGDAYIQSAQSINTTDDVVKKISENPHAIGYGGLAYGPQVIHCHLDGMAATRENIRNDRYPLIRYLYLYTVDTPRNHVKNFIDWILKDGQQIVKAVGYMPLWELE